MVAEHLAVVAPNPAYAVLAMLVIQPEEERLQNIEKYGLLCWVKIPDDFGEIAEKNKQVFCSRDCDCRERATEVNVQTLALSCSSDFRSLVVWMVGCLANHAGIAKREDIVRRQDDPKAGSYLPKIHVAEALV